ncbi:MAG: ParB/RepB/Spo0J family partition protein [Bacteroides sp.]|nr:ParB/RepB/Spo0J family partition protein [Prevotella sp.]MCM1407682.1 ParB/RepB/Spo0J family partition protein [Treponema brennaborense]MCM1469168.1 ParB/RepB/Spo0J family partition protein [Bacteroides sp.]
MAKSGLGKGIDALMGGTAFQPEENFPQHGGGSADNSAAAQKNAVPFAGITVSDSGELLADVSLLKPNPRQPRTEFDEASLRELADSIKEHGIIQPVLIENAEDGFFYIIAGERRTRAARLAGLEKIPVRINNFSEQQKLEVALIENIQRENLNPLEEALAYRSLMELGDLSQDETARRVGKNRSTVANALRLLKLPEDMQSALADGQITPGHARALLSVTNPADQRVLFAKITGNALSVRDAERAASELNGSAAVMPSPKNAKPAPAKDPDLAHIEQQMIEKLGTKVSVKGSFERGCVQIEYFSRDDLDRLYSLILGE